MTSMLKASNPAILLTSRIDDRKLLLVFGVLISVLLVLFVAYPLWTIFRMSFISPQGGWSLNNYVIFFSEPRLVGIVFNTFAMTITTTILTLSLAYLFSYAMVHSAIPFKHTWILIALSPLFAPSLIHALGFQFLLGRNGLLNMAFNLGFSIYGFWGLVFSNTLYAFPHAVLILRASLAFADQRTYESATMLGASGWRIFRTVTVPASRYGLMSAAFIVFAVTITDFGNAIIIGGNYKVLATEIYTQVVGQANFNLGAVVSMVLLFPTAIAISLERWITKRQPALVTEKFVPLQVKPRRIFDTIMLICVGLICTAIITVIGIVIYASLVRLWPYSMELTLRNYLEPELQNGFEPLLNSIWMALMTAILGVSVTTLAAYVVHKMSGRFSRILYFFSILPGAVPGMVLGLGYIFVFNNPANPLVFLYGSLLLLSICTSYHFHAQGFLTAITSFKQVSAVFDEASAMLGGSMVRTLRKVTLSIIWPSLVRSSVFFFMQAMVTLSAVIFLFSPASTVASVVVVQLEDYGDMSAAAAFATLIMLSVIAILTMLQGLMRLIGFRNMSLIG
ncbi:2-aminoethylphosphonate ABC transporter permease protein [Olavius sp. associated proteobacterium Delta 1]|nr:2-aminoethylphosphonate ABC transporter permease protein [Olavius sp. associated proteobacterium Delta 1]